MLNIKKYKRNPVIHYPEREWPNKEIEKAPIWCSVDLRDGNQALVEPMVVEEKIEFFNMLGNRDRFPGSIPDRIRLLKTVSRAQAYPGRCPCTGSGTVP